MTRGSGVSVLASSNNSSCRLRHWLPASAFWNRLCSSARFIHCHDAHGLLDSENQGLGVTKTVTPVLSQGWGRDAAIEASVVDVTTNALGASTTITLFAESSRAFAGVNPVAGSKPMCCNRRVCVYFGRSNAINRCERVSTIGTMWERAAMSGTS
jgi:hypothetical protein